MLRVEQCLCDCVASQPCLSFYQRVCLTCTNAVGEADCQRRGYYTTCSDNEVSIGLRYVPPGLRAGLSTFLVHIPSVSVVLCPYFATMETYKHNTLRVMSVTRGQCDARPIRLPSQRQGITAHWLVPKYTAW